MVMKSDAERIRGAGSEKIKFTAGVFALVP